MPSPAHQKLFAYEMVRSRANAGPYRKWIGSSLPGHLASWIYTGEVIRRNTCRSPGSGLMSYGADLKESFERAGDLVARIFKGTQPGELPFEQPTRYPFVINLKTAKATASTCRRIWWRLPTR